MAPAWSRDSPSASSYEALKTGKKKSILLLYLDLVLLYIHVLHIITSDMQGMVWGEPELSHVWEFDHMVFFHSHK